MGSEVNSAQQDNLPPSGMMTQSDYFQREITQQDLENMKSNKYLKKVDSINDQNKLAEKLEAMKLTHMLEESPNYPLGS